MCTCNIIFSSKIIKMSTLTKSFTYSPSFITRTGRGSINCFSQNSLICVFDFLREMERKKYLILFILCDAFPRKIGTLSELNIRKSSDLYIRKKRIVDASPNGDRPVLLQQVPYIVNILRNEISYCGGSILDPTIILTAAHCVSEGNEVYSILSNSAIADRGIRHKIMRKIIHPQYEQHQLSNDLALLVISPPINFETSRNRRIPICNGHLPPNSRGIISGWGCHRIREGRMEYPLILRSITVPIISMKLCRTFYRHANLTNRNMCTLDGNREKNCAKGDSGGSLVVNDQLLGVLSWAEETSHQGYPDVFINLMYPAYRVWINSYLPRY